MREHLVEIAARRLGPAHFMGTPESVVRSFSWLFAIFAAVFSRAGVASPDVNTLVQRSVIANESDWRAEPGYEHWERCVTGGEARTYQVLMIEGTPYKRLVAINDQILSLSKQRDEQQKLGKLITERRSESSSQRADRLEAYSRQHDRVGAFFRELGPAFEFTLSGERPVGSRSAYVVTAVPRRHYSPPTIDARVLASMSGELWIDSQTFHWVKVTAGVHQAIALAGVFVRLEPGTVLEMEKAPVADDIWLTSHFALRSQTRILSLVPHRMSKDTRYYNYTTVSP